MIASKLYQKPVCRQIWTGLLLLVVSPAFAWAFKIGPDIEKPKPEFTRRADQITAKLIPRAKSTSVEIRFQVKGGRLASVSAYDWETAERPEVNVKNFKSSLFEVRIDNVPPGGEVVVSIISDFFISSTRYFIFNPHLSSPWIKDAPVENISLGNRVQELTVAVKDGSPLDADGAVDGRITVIGGPRDSFWGYALGTLFIRFFGIFIVLFVLMIGMIVSGKVFQLLDRKKTRADTAKAQRVALAEKADASGGKIVEFSPEAAAAVAAALHLHFSASAGPHSMDLSISPLTSWTLHGRDQIMGERFITFNRSKR
jgi:hypothetical protein